GRESSASGQSSPSRAGAAKPSSRGVMAVLGALVVCSATASALIWRAHRDAPVTAPSPTPGATQAQAATTASSPAPPASAALADVVRIELAASPAEARILLDGSDVGNPYRARLPKDTRSHTVRVTAA